MVELIEILRAGLFSGHSLEHLRLTKLTVIPTDECNFGCIYCYQPKGKQRLKFEAIARAIDFFHPFFAPECVVSFYGGEPLLAFEEIKQTVECVERLPKKGDRKVRYSLTTNGSLLDEEILGFLDDHEFSLALSFDGLAQDISRRKGSFDFLASLIPRILARPRILLETNSVFSEETIGYLSESIECITQMGIRTLDVNFAHLPAWTSSSLNSLQKEIARVGNYFESQYEHPQDVPWVGFCEEPERAVACCTAGLNQMALSAQGTLWGCALFPHYFMNKDGTEEYKKYCFGDVNSFAKNAQDIYARKMVDYSGLRMDRFSTPDRSCLMCREVEYCRVCPVAAALTTGEMGRIPVWICQVGKIMRKEKRLLLNRFKKKRRGIPRTSPH